MIEVRYSRKIVSGKKNFAGALIGLLLALLIFFGYAFESLRPLFWKISFLVITIIVIYYLVILCHNYCLQRTNHWFSSHTYSITGYNNNNNYIHPYPHPHQQPFSRRVSTSFECISRSTTSNSVFPDNHTIVNNRVVSSIRPNHVLPRIVSIDRSSSDFENYRNNKLGVRTPPPKYEDVVNNQLPTYSEAVFDTFSKLV